MRILILNWRDSSHPEGGGSERYAEQLAHGLIEAGHEVSLHCAAHAKAPAAELIGGLRVSRKGGRLTVYLHGLAAVLRSKPDAVIDVQNHLPFFSATVHKRVITVVHHLGREQWLATFGAVVGRTGWWVESWLAPRAHRRSHYVAVSQPTRADLIQLGVAAERISVVHNATDPAPQRPQPVAKSDGPTIAVVGRMMPHKQISHAVDVTARLVGEFPGLQLRLIGDGPLQEAVRQRAIDLGVQDQVTFMGHLDEPSKHDAVASSWLFMCPSLKEGWGRVVMEAAVQGIPSVAYRNAGGLSESIVHGETGLLADNLDELTEHVRWLLKDQAMREAMGAAAATYASSFTVQRAVAGFTAVLAKL